MRTLHLLWPALLALLTLPLQTFGAATGPGFGGGGGGGGGSATNAIPFLNGAGTNTSLYNPTFASARNYAVTNAGTSSNLVADWNGPSFFRCQMTNHTTITMTNPPAAGSTPRPFTIEVAHVGGPSNLLVQTAGPIPIIWYDGVGPNMNSGATNYLDLWFNGTNVIGSTRQDIFTGDRASAQVRSNNPAITGLRMPGDNVASNRVWVATNSTTGQGEWRDRPRVGVYRTITVGAGGLLTNLTSGALLKYEETVANFVNHAYLEFSGTVTNLASYSQPMPETWDRSTGVEIKFYWSSTNSAANQTNVWGAAVNFVDDDDPVDGAFGTEVVASDPVSAINDLMITTAFVPTAGSSAGAAGAILDVRLRRLPGHAGDNLGGVSKLYAIVIRYFETTTEPTSSW